MQKIQLSIPEPCHENWGNMTPTDQGRFCNSCAKTVVDFSLMTDTELLHYFSGLQNEKVCGRALPAQLNRAITLPREPKKRLFWYWNYIMMFFMFFAKSNHTNAQTKGKVEAVPVVKQPCTRTLGMMVPIALLNHAISGKLTTEKGIPVPFATVHIMGSNTTVSADADGIYSIKAKDSDVLEFSRAGFESKTVTIHSNSSKINVELKAVQMLGEVVVTNLGIKRKAVEICHYETTKIDTEKINLANVIKPSRVLGGISIGIQVTPVILETKKSIVTNVIHKITDTLSQINKPSTIKIYPNPVQRGNTLSINLKLEANDYTIQITDIADRIVLKKQITVSAKEQLEKIETDSRWTAGIYFITVFNSNNKMVSKNSFSVQ